MNRSDAAARYLVAHDEPVTAIRGIGPAVARALERLGVTTVAELVQLAPRRYEDRSQLLSLVEAARRGEGLVAAEVIRHDSFPFRGRQTLKIVIADAGSQAALVCFGRNFLARSFPVGARILVWGQFRLRRGEIQTAAFEAEVIDEEDEAGPAGILPVYPLTERLTQSALRRFTREALNHLRNTGGLIDPLPTALLRSEGLVALEQALSQLHYPDSFEAADQARQRLVFEELFLFQFSLAREALRRRNARRRARPTPHRELRPEVVAALPFSLTADQQRVVTEIEADLRGPHPMSRLLQGDVGSGKTLVAILSALVAIERGEQVAFVVPTELLARQHARTLARILTPVEIRLALVLGSLSAKQRGELYPRIADGSAQLVVGTHALFAEAVEYANLSLVIIDEQHRFGVQQREALSAKGTDPDVLLMSATPIPRSLALTAFGDSEISTIRQMPPGRKPVRTHLVRFGNEERAYSFIEKQLAGGRQAYCVYPAIEETTSRALRNVETMAGVLATRFPDHAVAAVHSRLEEEERDRVMSRFVSGDVDILVATSVVEVGVDVPNAAAMVIEHAELFGLAALHQLRGRVGRGAEQAYCVLIYDEPLTDEAKERLRAIFSSTDGFTIAEEDLRIRGPGELAGTRQAGFLQFRFADIRINMKEMIRAREYIGTILRDDPGLLDPAHAALRGHYVHSRGM